MDIYQFQARKLNGEQADLSSYRGKVLLIVNTASACGLTPQYEGLQKLYDTYRDKGLEILGFPCNQFGGQEPGTHEQIRDFCQRNYGVTFAMFEKIEVNGPGAHPLYQYLKSQAPFEGEPSDGGNDIRWNFTKFLVDRSGRVVRRFEPRTLPSDIVPAIESLL